MATHAARAIATSVAQVTASQAEGPGRPPATPATPSAGLRPLVTAVTAPVTSPVTGLTAFTAPVARPTDSEATDSASSERGDSCGTERSRLRSRKRGFVSELPRRVEQGARAIGTGYCTGDYLPRRSRQARFRSRAAQRSRPLVSAVTAPVTAFSAPVTAITATKTYRRVASRPGFRGGVGRCGSGFHQGGRTEQKSWGSHRCISSRASCDA